MKIKIIFFCFFLFFSFVTLAKTNRNTEVENKNPVHKIVVFNVKDPFVQIKTYFGVISVELYEYQTPQIVHAFLKLVHEGYFNETIFHRIIDGVFIQTGGYDLSFRQKKLILPTIQSNNKETDLLNTEGTVVAVGSHGDTMKEFHFFVNLAKNTQFDSRALSQKRNEVFGKIVKGLDVAQKIAHIKIGQKENMYNVPFYSKEAEILKIERVEFKDIQ